MNTSPTADAVRQVADWIRAAQCVVVLTGAGISTESGIPDFRGPQGVWTRNPGAERLATIDHYLSSREARAQAWRNRLESPIWRAEPNAGHYALAELERRGKLDTLITQNVDGLHQKAGSSPERVVEIHGTVHRYTCLQCGDGGPIEEILERVRGGEEDPPCRRCGGILKTATISFGQNLDPEVLARCYQAARRCDLFLAIGTSLVVYPAAYLPGTALESGARLVIINGEPTPYDDHAHAVIRERIGSVLPAIVAAV